MLNSKFKSLNLGKCVVSFLLGALFASTLVVHASIDNQDIELFEYGILKGFVMEDFLTDLYVLKVPPANLCGKFAATKARVEVALPAHLSESDILKLNKTVNEFLGGIGRVRGRHQMVEVAIACR